LNSNKVFANIVQALLCKPIGDADSEQNAEDCDVHGALSATEPPFSSNVFPGFVLNDDIAAFRKQQFTTSNE
jgi:hypothetical protein